MTSPVIPSDFRDIGWYGHWIWVDPPPAPRFGPEFAGAGSKQPEVRALFRKTFDLARVPERVPARMTADSRYLLFANGREVARGPIRSQPRRMHYDLVDLAPYLRPGANTVAAFVVFYGSARNFWMPPPRSMGMGHGGVFVFEANVAPGEWLVSDASWKALKSDAWTEDWKVPGELHPFFGDGIPTEVVDGRRLPYGWEQPGFDDAAWGPAHILAAGGMGGAARSQPPTEPYGPLYPRPIALLGGDLRQPVAVRGEYLAAPVELQKSDPVRRLQESLDFGVTGETGNSLPLLLDLAAGGAARISLDMGGIVMGQVQFEIDAPEGTVFDFSYTEDPLAKPRGPFDGMHSGTRYIARGANDSFKLYDAFGFRYGYILVHGASGPVTVKSFAVQEDVYPWQPGASFECSDAELSRLFTAGIRTVQLNSRDAFTDCPTREQQAWVGDSVVHQMVHLVTNTDWRLAWQYLNLSNSPRSDGILPMTVVGSAEAAGEMTIPDWSLHWVHGVYNLYRFTGDRDEVLKYMPSVARVLRWYAPFQNADGLLQDLIEWNLVDWSAVSVDGVTSIITALWARGLREFAEMAAWLEEQSSAAWADALYAKARAGFDVFWDEGRGSYVDHIVEGVVRPEMSQLAGACAIVSGLAPQERWGRIIDAITNPDALLVRTWQFDPDDPDGPPAFGQPRRYKWDLKRQIIMAEPFMQYVVHDAVAQAGKADMLPDLYHRWLPFLSGGYDTIGEDWQHGTHVHGWSCTPTKDMIFYTLGVMPAAPGYARARIAPRLSRLAWARGIVPSPHGLISVGATPAAITVESPVPFTLDLAGQPPRDFPAGAHEIKTG